MTRPFGVLIPSTNTTVEMECRLLPATYQAHVGRLMSSGGGSFSPGPGAGSDYQSRVSGGRGRLLAEPRRGHRLSVAVVGDGQGRDGDIGPDVGKPLRRRLRRR